MSRTFWKDVLRLGLALGFSAGTVEARSETTAPTVTVGVHNRAGVSEVTLTQAERVASSIFKDAGLDVEFVNCRSSGRRIPSDPACEAIQFPRHLQLTVAREPKNLKRTTLGIAFLDENGIGCYSDVFLEPAEDLRESFQLSLGGLLGHAAAHEIAHLLLGTNSHAETGIMRAHWNGQDFDHIRKEILRFTPAQGKAMRETVARGLCVSERTLGGASSGRD